MATGVGTGRRAIFGYPFLAQYRLALVPGMQYLIPPEYLRYTLAKRPVVYQGHQCRHCQSLGVCPTQYSPTPRPEPAIKCTSRPAPIARAALQGTISVVGGETETVCDPAPRSRIQKHVSFAPETHNRVHLYAMSPISVPLHCRTNQKLEVHGIPEAPDQVSRVCEFLLPSSFPIPESADVMPANTHPGGLPRAEQSGSRVFEGADQGSACKGKEQSNTVQTGVQGPQQTAPVPADQYTLVGKRHTQAHNTNRREPALSPVIHQTVWTPLLLEQPLAEPAVNGGSGPLGDQAGDQFQVSTVVPEEDDQLEIHGKAASALLAKYRRWGHCGTRFMCGNSLHGHLLNCKKNTSAGAVIRSMIDSQPVLTCSQIIETCWEQYTWGDCLDCQGDHSCIDRNCAAVYAQHSVNKLWPPYIFKGTLAGQDTSA